LWIAIGKRDVERKMEKFGSCTPSGRTILVSRTERKNGQKRSKGGGVKGQIETPKHQKRSREEECHPRGRNHLEQSDGETQ